ncbi:hypothetical protein WNY78_14475 [Psychroserpens sp. AS72]
MKILNSNIAHQIIKEEQSKAGVIHFFNHIAVVEFNEGIHADIKNGKKILESMMNYFGNSKPFGIIANRINSYSIALLETVEVRSMFPNLVAYGIVSYNFAGRMNADIESQFCTSEDISFNNLYEGIDTVYNRVISKIPLPLN